MPGNSSGSTYSYTLINPPILTNGTYRNVSLLQINNGGEILGTVTSSIPFLPNGPAIPFLFQGGTYTAVAVPGATFTTALHLDDSGRVVGSYQDALGRHAYVYQGAPTRRSMLLAPKSQP